MPQPFTDPANQAPSLPQEQPDKLLTWLAELEHEAAWDREIERDSDPGGKLAAVLQRLPPRPGKVPGSCSADSPPSANPLLLVSYLGLRRRLVGN